MGCESIINKIKVIRLLDQDIPPLFDITDNIVTIDNAKGYLDLENTLCVGGSWVAPQHLIENKDWKSITDLARTASNIAF